MPLLLESMPTLPSLLSRVRSGGRSPQWPYGDRRIRLFLARIFKAEIKKTLFLSEYGADAVDEIRQCGTLAILSQRVLTPKVYKP